MKKNIKTLLFISIFAIIITSCVKDLKDIDISMVTSYTGTVVEQSTMQTIEGVKVMVTNGENIYADTVTDIDGIFLLPNVNMDELNDSYYLFLDGTSLGLPSKKENLKGLGLPLYDYKKIPLYDKTSPYLALPSFNYNGHNYRVAPSPGNTMDWYSAYSYCSNYSIDGVTGWRLPTKDELVQMYSMRNTIGEFIISGSGSYYWSSTPDTYSDYYNSVNFSDGSIYSEYSSKRNSCRPIRMEN